MKTIKIRTREYLSDKVQIVEQRVTKTLIVDGREFAIMREPNTKRDYWICVDVETGAKLPNSALADNLGRTPNTAGETYRKAEAWLNGRVSTIPWSELPKIN